MPASSTSATPSAAATPSVVPTAAPTPTATPKVAPSDQPKVYPTIDIPTGKVRSTNIIEQTLGGIKTTGKIESYTDLITDVKDMSFSLNGEGKLTTTFTLECKDENTAAQLTAFAFDKSVIKSIVAAKGSRNIIVTTTIHIN